MSNPFDRRCTRRAVILALALAALPSLAPAAPGRVEPFTMHTWSQFQERLPRPAAVIFSTTDCAYCPDVVEQMARDIERRRQPRQARIPLIVVVMDGDGNPELLRDPHYRKADRLFAFAGPQAPLEYAVNPKWRGIVPYVALFAAQGAPKLIAGRPAPAAIADWLATGSDRKERGGK